MRKYIIWSAILFVGILVGSVVGTVSYPYVKSAYKSAEKSIQLKLAEMKAESKAQAEQPAVEGIYPEPTIVDTHPAPASSEAVGPTVDNPYMLAYQNSLAYTVPANLRVPANLLDGFDPVKSLVMTDFAYPDGTVVSVPGAPANVSNWYCFPQDYSNGDDSNPGCKKAQVNGQLPWDKPVAGYNDGNNWSSDSTDGWSASDIQAQNWRVETGYQVCHPAVGCLKDPNGGAVMVLFINFHDSDEVWNVRNQSAVFIDSGFEGYGVMWDLSPSGNVGEGIADLRNHYLYNLSAPVSTSDNHYRGQCGDSGLCDTITYVVVARVWDRPELGINYSHFELIDYGQWHRP